MNSPEPLAELAAQPRIDLEAWDPAYGASLETGEAGSGPPGDSSATIDPAVEVTPAAWRPLLAPGDTRAPDVVLLVDGVRRVDAQAWITGGDGATHGAIAASYAAGVVRCDRYRGVAEVVEAKIARGLFSASPAAVELTAGAVRYPVHRVRRDDPVDLSLAVQRELAALEKAVAVAARRDSHESLLIVDGPLHGRTHLPNTLGYVKSHRVEYLPQSLSAVVTALPAGTRCPVFRLGTSWNRYTWYLRLPGSGRSPWAGIVRVECSSELPAAQAVELADLATVTLPRFASASYKDPRAPQNLVPIAGLERRLRGLLGDARLLHRALTIATRRRSSTAPPRPEAS